MNLRPDHLFLQSFTLIYFCGWLWLGVSTAILPVRPFTRRVFGSVVGMLLIISLAIWGYLFVVTLAAGMNPVHVPLTIDLLLIVVTATTYVPLRPWSSHPTEGIPKFVRVARVELGVLVVGLPIAGVAIIAPFGSYIVGWLPTLVEDNPVLCVLIIGLAIYTIAVCGPKIRAYWLAVFVMLIVLATTYIMMFTALVAAV